MNLMKLLPLLFLLAISSFGQGFPPYINLIPYNGETEAIEAARWCLQSMRDTLEYGSTEDNSTAIIIKHGENTDELFRKNPNRYKAVCLMGLNDIPASIAQQKELEVLTILNIVDISPSGWRKVDGSIRSLPKLREIRIIGNLLAEGYRTLFANPNIEVIKICSQDPTILTRAEVTYPPNLKEFWSSFASHATPALAACSHLKVLSINWRFAWYPTDQRETMSSVDFPYGFWPKDSLPGFYYSFRELEVLDLTTEFQFYMDDRISNLGNLKHLILGTCYGVSPEIAKCQNLKHVYLLEEIFDLWESFTLVESIESVEISGITGSIPAAIKKYTNLKKLVMPKFFYHPLPNEFSELQHLKHLVLGCNLAHGRSIRSYLLPSEDLDLFQQPLNWNTIPAGSQLARDADTVAISEGSIKDLSFLENALDLNFLLLSYDRIKSLPENFGNHTKLQSLYLWGNALRKLPHSFTQITQLDVLDLGGNKFRHFPKELLYESSPVLVDLSVNHIKEIPGDIWKMARTDTLILYANQIKKIPPSILQMKNLKHLDLRGNPIGPADIPAEIADKVLVGPL